MNKYLHKHKKTELVPHYIPSEKVLFCSFFFCCIAFNSKKSSFMDIAIAECSSLALHRLIKVSFPIQVQHGL